MQNLSVENERFMDEAIKEAEKGLKEDEVPVGCVVVSKGNIVSRGHNMTNCESDPLSHAELVALRCCETTRDLVFYVTCEPCIMCFGVLERIDARVFYGCKNAIFGDSTVLGHRSEIHCEILFRKRAVALLQEFFLGENQNAPPEKRKKKDRRKPQAASEGV